MGPEESDGMGEIKGVGSRKVLLMEVSTRHPKLTSKVKDYLHANVASMEVPSRLAVFFSSAMQSSHFLVVKRLRQRKSGARRTSMYHQPLEDTTSSFCNLRESQ